MYAPTPPCVNESIGARKGREREGVEDSKGLLGRSILGHVDMPCAAAAAVDI